MASVTAVSHARARPIAPGPLESAGPLRVQEEDDRALPEAAAQAAPGLAFGEVYEMFFDFVWRNLRRFGVAEADLEDALQEVFVVVHRKLPGFEGRSRVEIWLFGIVRRIASDYRRAKQRRGPHDALPAELAHRAPDPHDQAARAEGVQMLDRLLQQLDEDERAVFVLAELEEMTAPEIAEVLAVKLNTVYSRLRLARRDFELAVAREAGDEAPVPERGSA